MLNKLELLHIINGVKEQDEGSMESLLTIFRPMMVKIVNKFDIYGADFRLDKQDLLQEANIALYRAALEFVEGRGAKFSTFAYTVIYRAVLKTVERYNKVYTTEGKSLDGESFSETWEGYASDSYYDSPTKAYEFNELTERVINLINDLNVEERRVLELRQQNMSYKEIGELLGTSPKHVDYVIQKIKKRVENEIMRD